MTSSIATAAAPALLRLARADTPPTTLKLHHAFSAVSGVHDKFLVPWARKIESESGGRLRVDLFPSMQLGGAPAALFDQARDGTADLVWAAPSLTPGRFAKIETFELPFLPSRRALVSSRALTAFAAANLQDEFAEFHPICFSCSDSAVIHATRPIRTTEDLSNLRLHVQTRFAAEAMRALGAHPVIMPNAQLPAALTEHVIDGCLDPWHLVPPLRLNDLLRTHTEFSDFSPSARSYVLAMNKASYERLPRELKSVIDNNSGQVAAGMAGTMWDLQAAAAANMVVERGDLIVTLLPETVARWRKTTEPVIDAWRKEVKEQKIDGAKLLLAARILVARYAIEPEPTQPPPAERQHYPEPTGSPQGGAPPRLDNRTLSGTPPGTSAAKSSVRAQPSVQSPQPPLSTHLDTPASAKLGPPAAGGPSTAPPAVPSSPLAPAGKPAAAPLAGPVTGSTTAPASPSSAAIAPTSPSPTAAPAPPSIVAAPSAPPPPAGLKPPPKTLDIPL